MTRILIVDQDRAICALIREVIDAEVVFTETEHSAQVIDRLHPPLPDLIFLSVGRPEEIEVCEQLKADPVLSSIPVIVYGVAVFRSAAKAAGADSFLAMPDEINDLVARAQQILNDKVT